MKQSILVAVGRVAPVAVLGALAGPAFATALPVPEPSTMILLAGGVGAALIIGRYKGRK